MIINTETFIKAIFDDDVNTIKWYVLDQCYDEQEFLKVLNVILAKQNIGWPEQVTQELWLFIKETKKLK